MKKSLRFLLSFYFIVSAVCATDSNFVNPDDERCVGKAPVSTESYGGIQGFFRRLFRSNYNTLDADHTKLQDDYSTLDTNHTKLQGDYSTLDTNYTKLQGDYSTLDTNYTKLQGDYSTLDTNHTKLQGDYSTLDTNHTKLQGDYSTLKGNYNTLESNHNNLQTNHQKLNDLFTNQLVALNDNTNRFNSSVETFNKHVANSNGSRTCDYIFKGAVAISAVLLVNLYPELRPIATPVNGFATATAFVGLCSSVYSNITAARRA